MKNETDLTRENVYKLEEEALKLAKDDPYRMHFHLMPPSGWLNDPNGLSEKNGINHIFFQYTPQDIKPTTDNCWGHYTTKDFVNFTYELPPLYPDTIYEKNGVYSGSAITTPEGIKAYYTGNVKHPGDFDYINKGREQNLILAEDYDPKTGEFKTKKILMSNEDYPEEMTLHVRDPKVIKKDGKLYLLLGARTKDDIGSAIVYESEDGENFKHVKTILGNEELGYMWECPDAITIDNKDFLIISPQGIEAQGDRFNNIYQAGYLPLEVVDGELAYGELEELDRGFDFYAPQTYIDEEGRNILIGWMGVPDAEYDYPTKENGWIHALTIPRVLSRKDKKLIQQPIKEIEQLRGKEIEVSLEGPRVEVDIPEVFEFVLKEPSESGKIIIKDACVLSWNEDTFTLTFEDNNEKIVKAGAQRTTRRAKINGLKDLRVFVDTSSIEVFINNGEEVFTTRFFPDNNSILEFEQTSGKLTIYELTSFKVTRPDGTVVFDL